MQCPELRSLHGGKWKAKFYCEYRQQIKRIKKKNCRHFIWPKKII